MKQDTKETIGSRGTVAGFRPLIGEEQWFCDDPSKESIRDGFRPFLKSEISNGFGGFTNRPLPPPQVETFEAHGHVWYRHVPGDAAPTDDLTGLRVLYSSGVDSAFFAAESWKTPESQCGIIGYRFPDFPAVRTPAQQEQPVIRGVGPYKAIEATDVTKQRLLEMYHGWCDVAPDSVPECIADVAKVLYPTDADRCEAEFQKWWNGSHSAGKNKVAAIDAWYAAWNAAKQQNP